MSQTYRMPNRALFTTLWQAQNGQCAVCGEAMLGNRFDAPHARIWARRRATLDHIWPRSKGGQDTFENYQLVHAECNKRKGDKTP